MLLFDLAKSMERHNIPGGAFLIRKLAAFGLLHRATEYDLGGVKFSVPLDRLTWDRKDVLDYEERHIRAFRQAIAPLEKATLIDCGADIGTFSVLASLNSKIDRIIAFEPNADVTDILRDNLSRLPLQSEVIGKAVSNFDGKGYLESPSYDPHYHARFLRPGGGPISVARIDSLKIRGDIAIKIDTEGGELEALQGAKDTIVAARRCVVAFEAHPRVSKRIGRDPIECLRFLVSLRPFRFLVPETGISPPLSEPLMRPGQTEVWNVIATCYSFLD
jgi:FkbM family methyltransferase